jgi:hypothetical protein
MIIRGGMHEASPVWCQLPGHFAHHMHGHHVGAPLRIATIIPPPSWGFQGRAVIRRGDRACIIVGG